MILAKERKRNPGNICFELVESTTRKVKMWVPPRNLQWCQIEDALLHAAELFEKEVLEQSSTAANMFPHNTLYESVVCDADTQLKRYVEAVFIPRKTVTIAEHTRDSWQRCLDLRITPRLGNNAVGSITAGQVTDFLLGCQAEGLAVSTVQKYYTLLNQIFKMACATDIIEKNPMLKVEPPRPRKDEIVTRQVPAYNAKEIAYIEECLQHEPLKWRTLISLLNDTGIRVGECCALTWDAIDFQARTVMINSTLCYTPAKGVYLSTPKNRQARTVSVSDDIMQLLLLLSIENYRTVNSSYVFTKKNSAEPMHPQSPGKYLRKFQKKYGIEGLHPHKLRHSYASIAITNGADIASVSENLGHSDKAITLNTYTSANLETMRKASDIRRQAVKDAAAHF